MTLAQAVNENPAPPESTFRWWFARTIFPLVVVLSIGSALALIGRGWSAIGATAFVQGLAFLLVFLCERVVPYHESWKHSKGDIHVDAGHAITLIVTGGLVQPAIVAGGVVIAAWLSAHLGIGLWPLDWPLYAQLALSLVVVEFFQYWVHRFQHEWDVLWRFHAVHHSAPRLYWLNASRFHFVDILMHNVAGHLPLIALGAPVEMLALWTLFSAVHGIFQHANLPLVLGPLNWIFSMAELHRWHHSPRLEEANHNYGQNLIFFDTLFGTRFLPRDRQPPETIGIETLPTFPMGWWAQVLSPLRWKRIQAESQRQLAASRSQ